MKKTIYYQIHPSPNKIQGCKNNGFTYPFFKKGGGINGHVAYFNNNVECFVMNDKKRKSTGHGGIYYSKVPYSIMSLSELISYNNYIKENVSFKFKIKKFFGFKTTNKIKSKIEYFFGLIF